MTVQAGQEAPDFELKDQAGELVSLAGFRGDKAVTLVFYPFTFTGVCQGELCRLRDDISSFEAAGVQVLAVSCDSPFAQKKWAEEQGFTFPVLSDFAAPRRSGQGLRRVQRRAGLRQRATFVIDKDGKVVDTFATDNLGTPRDKSRYEEAIAKL